MRILILGVVFFVAGCFTVAQAQYEIVYAFGANGPNDGAGPNGGLVFDAAGNLYGTTGAGGLVGAGTVFELSPMQDGTWQETVLYSFCPDGVGNGCPDGRSPRAGLLLDANGNLYGTTFYGGANQQGTVFEVSPPARPGGGWTEQVLWSFGEGTNDGSGPIAGLVGDADGNLYGTTEGSTSEGAGVVFELSPGPTGWTESLLHVFCLNYPDCSDGALPIAGVTFDKSGNLYGTTMAGGIPNRTGWGVVYKLSPANGSWTETVLKVFTSGTGGQTSAGITIDPAGHLYGAVTQGGPRQCGGFFRLNTFVGFPLSGGNGCSPRSDLLYSSRTLFGSTAQGGANSQGVLFKFTKNGNQVSQTILYNFCQQANCADGRVPNGPLTLRKGQLYGAAALGGLKDGGVIFQIPE